jgi:hypothetical protein
MISGIVKAMINNCFPYSCDKSKMEVSTSGNEEEYILSQPKMTITM